MKLTVIAPDNVYQHEVDPSVEVQDIHALVEADAGLPSSSFALSSDSGIPLVDPHKTLEAYALKDDCTLFLTPKPTASSSLGGGASSNDELERMRQHALNDPGFMAELRQNDPEMAEATADASRFREHFMRHLQRMRAAQEKSRMVNELNADPYDIEAQRRIEEEIRMQAVLENKTHAFEYSPEAFADVTMLYINVEVNGYPIKAFVDSGAQATIITPECAKACGIMRLLDPTFAGVAMGVGSTPILGRVHSAQIKLGGLFLPTSFSVMELANVDLLLGLDMLKRHQCCIDLAANVLRINTTEVPFLAEHELPEKARRRNYEEIAGELRNVPPPTTTTAGDAPKTSEFPGSGQTLGKQPAAVVPPSASSSGSTGGQSSREADIQTLIGLGAPRAQAVQLLEATDGNIDAAVSMLFD